VPVTWSQYYEPIRLAPGELARGLETVVNDLAVGRTLKLWITRQDDLLENLIETKSSENEYRVLDTVCVLGRRPHREISALWNEPRVGLFLNLTLSANSVGDNKLYMIVSSEDGRVLNAFVERLEQRLALTRIPEVQKAASSFDKQPVVAQLPLPTPTHQPVGSDLRKENRTGQWIVLSTLVTALGALLVKHC